MKLRDLWHTMLGALQSRRGHGKTPARMRVKRTRVTKWDGDPPRRDERKLPAEVIEHDFDKGTKRVFRPVNGQLQEVKDDPSEG